MSKIKDTKEMILEVGTKLAGRMGLEGISIGVLAKEVSMSKSGLFAHFESKENLQIALLNHASQDFSRHVIIPALKTQRGIPRIKALVKNWNNWCAKLSGSCIFVSAGTEYSERPGKVRDCLLKQQEQWLDSLRRIAQSAIKAGDFRDDIDCNQFAFDLYSLLLGFHYYHKLLRNGDTENRQQKSLNHLLDQYRPQKHKSSKSN